MGHLYTKCNNNIARFKAQASIDIISQNIITQFVAIANSEDSFALIDVAFHLSSVKKKHSPSRYNATKSYYDASH